MRPIIVVKQTTGAVALSHSRSLVQTPFAAITPQRWATSHGNCGLESHKLVPILDTRAKSRNRVGMEAEFEHLADRKTKWAAYGFLSANQGFNQLSAMWRLRAWLRSRAILWQVSSISAPIFHLGFVLLSNVGNLFVSQSSEARRSFNLCLPIETIQSNDFPRVEDGTEFEARLHHILREARPLKVMSHLIFTRCDEMIEAPETRSMLAARYGHFVKLVASDGCLQHTIS
ncbi:uncharacterized protein UV8b_04524 [Ustilaginoidea virens]|uniref:Uncharacterized protein n=1 Tax=Ustilaginoidea virens TaxID=1159556 RepID=A0A8E5MH92_USTVR|nr:uncharacterized protein UV8b_04524 [Ustilaginoidea virens]QUC20283.1 hypothetical protein UV8b_04524 [Ustilaginoidea virens]